MKKGERDEVFTEVQHSKNCDVLGFYLNESSQNPVGISDPYILPEEAEAQREELAQDYAANEMQSRSPQSGSRSALFALSLSSQAPLCP